jgi:hypothetical protein
MERQRNLDGGREVKTQGERGREIQRVRNRRGC